MERKPDQEWSVHAQLTFTHGEPAANPPAAHPCYGFQRGNIVFTTKPPGDATGGIGGSGRRTPVPYGRRCMSTCNIKLDPQDRCLSPGGRCHHTVSLACPPAPGDECDVCAGRHSPAAARRVHTFTSHFCTRVPDKSATKSVETQTSRVFATPTPAPSTASLRDDRSTATKSTKSLRSTKRVSRSPDQVSGKSSLASKPTNDSKKKPPRTVHIDVYCTGSEGSRSSSDEEPSSSSRQTVFESESVRVVHTREDARARLPQGLCRQKRRTLSEASSAASIVGSAASIPSANASFVGSANGSYVGSDNASFVADTSSLGSANASFITSANTSGTSISSLYPTQRSSVSNFSLPTTLVTDSSGVTSSCGIFTDEPPTSWKDTDVESFRLNDLRLGLDRAESFEYDNSQDRLRIMQKERDWGNSNRLSPDVEKKHRVQQRRQQQYVERRGSPFPTWDAADSDDSETSSDLSDRTAGSEMAWSFGDCAEKIKHVKREDTVRRASRDTVNSEAELKKRALKLLESGSFSDSAAPSPVQQKFLLRDNIGPFGVKEPSPPRAKLESTVTTPFSSTGRKTDQMSRAEKFGSVVGTMRKPGHHVGPSKNPDCSCYNCQMHFEELGYRIRTRSLGDMPSSSERQKWRDTLGTLVQNRLTEDSGSGEWDLGTPV